MTLRTMERQIEALEKRVDQRLRAPVFLHPIGNGRYTNGTYAFTEEAVHRMIDDLFRTTPIYVIPSEEELAEGVWTVHETNQTPDDLRAENERGWRAGPSDQDRRVEALAENLAKLRDEPEYLRHVIERIGAERDPERERKLLGVVEAGLRDGVDFRLCVYDWLGYVFSEEGEVLLGWFIDMAEAYPQALAGYLRATEMLLQGGRREEARRLVLAACQNEELIWEEDLTDHTDAVSFLLKLCRNQLAETEALREAIGTDPLLRHYARFRKLNLDFDVDLLSEDA